MKRKLLIIFVVLIIGVTGVAVLVFDVFRSDPVVVITNFDECTAAGNLVMESYPRQCRNAAGETFTEDIGNELEKNNLIRVEAPRPNSIVISPLKVAGVARGYWFFEASFPVRITDEYGVELGIVPAQAEGEWMTEEFVPFRATLEFRTPTTKTGYLILEKDNPSGLPENADSLKIPISFRLNDG